jgi:DNA-binding MarR family transcriptional regulator
MSDQQLNELRAAFGELLGAERRLRGRDPRKPGELSTAQVRALIQLAKDEQVTAGVLAKRAELSPGAMTAMLDQLSDDGMITRRRSETDRRQVKVALTERGHEVVAAKRAHWDRIWRAALEDLDDTEVETAARVMRQIAALLDGIGR